MNRNDWQERNEGSRSFGREYGEDRPHHPAGSAAYGNDERRYRDVAATPRGWSGAQGAGPHERGRDERATDWRRDQDQERGTAGGFWRGMARGDSALFGAGEADYAGPRGGESRWGERGHADEEERALRDYGRHAHGGEYRHPGWQGNSLYSEADRGGPSPHAGRGGYDRDFPGEDGRQQRWSQDRDDGRAPDARRGPYRGRGPRNYARSDERITEDLNERLTDNDMLDASDISVQVADGVATLSGTVASRWMRHLAEDIADSCSGVKDIRNEITVAAADDAGDAPLPGVRP
ncbi:BON domain-containing protein [Stenotrophomonas sp. MYb238]|uniref:BON domain-containing protein n=1 Tax=Stenotrophomonas sp. MYb238 TaxID=2040281 RepID=UPI001292B5AA|nr:BON domain-containing protein [Stenotrophomonas sp. MYb238]MQP74670.1 BON domain-containing protein [Stenotrophomonas sp. MYb238]